MQTTRTLMQNMIWRGLYYVAAFIINLLIARHFEASLSGAVYYLSSIYSLALLLYSLSLESGIIYFLARQEIAASRLFNFALLWTLFTGILTLLIVYFLFNETYQGISRELILFSAVLYITGNLLITYGAGFFFANNDFKTPNIIIICGTLFLIITIPYDGGSLLPVINDGNYFYVYFGSFFAQGLVMAVAVKFRYIRTSVQELLSRKEFGMLLRYCGLAFVGNVIFFLLYRVDYYFVERFCNPVELGNYIQVSKLVHLFFVLPSILAAAVFPLTAGGKSAELEKTLTLISRTIFMVYLLVVLGLAITGAWLFTFVFGPSFTTMYQPFLLLIPGILALSGIFTLTAYFAGRNRIRVNIIGSLFALVVIIAGDLLFIPAYGIRAAALVSSAGYLVYQVYIIAVFKKEYDCPVTDFFIFSKSDWMVIQNKLKGLLNSKHESKQ